MSDTGDKMVIHECRGRSKRSHTACEKKRGCCSICETHYSTRWRKREDKKVCEKCFKELIRGAEQGVYVAPSKISGRGLFAARPIHTEDEICFYAGSMKKKAPPYKGGDDSRTIFIKNSRGTVTFSEDANRQRRPCLGHFANGDADPQKTNAHFEVKKLGRFNRNVLVADKPIPVDSEIVMDYGNPDYFN